MTKVLYVGDPHTQISNLEESHKLLKFVEQTACDNACDTIVFLGDQHHNHAIVRIEVQDFWRCWLGRLSVRFDVIALVGNHDRTGDAHNKVNAMRVFEGQSPDLTIVSDTYLPPNSGVGYLAYEHDPAVFVESANYLVSQGAKTIVCHQSFSGSKFENGYFDPQGINPDLVNADLIISGHIHMGQEFGKVWHPGTAMWLTSSDANQTKGIWVVEHSQTGSVVSRNFFDTSSIVTPIVSYQWNEGEEKPLIKEGARATIEMIGTSQWIAQNKADFSGKAIKSTITDSKAKVRIARKSFEEFVQQDFDLVSTISKSDFLGFLKELKIV